METALLHPQIDFPEDPGLKELPKLFDPDWVCRAYSERFGDEGPTPCRFVIRQFSHALGRVALVSYLAEWEPDAYLPSQHFVAKVRPNQPIEIYRFPDDPDLPGLKKASHPETARDLVNRHVLAMGARRARVEVIRYRPGNRAVLRHRIGRINFYVRVMRPSALPAFAQAWEVIGCSSFVAPRIAGHWPEGGVVWMAEILGENLRRQIRKGYQPDPAPLLDGLESLRRAPHDTGQRRPFDLSGAYRRAKRSLVHFARDIDATRISLE